MCTRANTHTHTLCLAQRHTHICIRSHTPVPFSPSELIHFELVLYSLYPLTLSNLHLCAIITPASTCNMCLCFDVEERWQQSAETWRTAVCTQPRRCTNSNGRSFPSTSDDRKAHSCSSVRGIRCNIARCYTLTHCQLGQHPSAHIRNCLPAPWGFPKPRCQKDHICPARQLNVPGGLKSLSRIFVPL